MRREYDSKELADIDRKLKEQHTNSPVMLRFKSHWQAAETDDERRAVIYAFLETMESARSEMGIIEMVLRKNKRGKS